MISGLANIQGKKIEGRKIEKGFKLLQLLAGGRAYMNEMK